MQRRLSAVAAAGSVLFGVAVFLPWAQASDRSVQLAGWGSGYTPQLRGMLVITCAAVALACLAAPLTMGVVRSVRLVIGCAEVAAVVALAATVSVVSSPAEFAGTAAAGVAAGCWLALFGEAATVFAALGALVTAGLAPEAVPA
jgi:hypothetical protein